MEFMIDVDMDMVMVEAAAVIGVALLRCPTRDHMRVLFAVVCSLLSNPPQNLRARNPDSMSSHSDPPTGYRPALALPLRTFHFRVKARPPIPVPDCNDSDSDVNLASVIIYVITVTIYRSAERTDILSTKEIAAQQNQQG